MPPLKLVFAGTPEFAAIHLTSLLDGPHQVIAVYTQPDRRGGRGKKLLASPVKQLAEAHRIPVYQPGTLKDSEAQQTLAGLKPDLMVVVAYGLILPQAVLDIPRLGCINVHASLLPRWRGAAPIERALLAGDSQSGVTIMQMDAGLDTGDILLRKTVPVGPAENRVQLTEKIASAGIEALSIVLDNIETLQEKAEPQEHSQSTYAPKLEKEEALIEWSRHAEQIDRQIRAGTGRNPAYCFLGDQRVRILEATVSHREAGMAPGTITEISRDGLLVACGQGMLRVIQLQLSGKNPVFVAALMNARPASLQPGARFADTPAAE